MVKKKMVNRDGRRITTTYQYDDRTGKLLRVLGKSTYIPKKKEEWEVTSPFLKIWEKK